MKRLTLPGGGWRSMQPALWLACIALPWINPFARGPSSTVQPWLFSALCMVVLAASHGLGRLTAGPVLTLLALCVAASVNATNPTDMLALFGACVVLLLGASTAACTSQRAEFVRAMAKACLAAALVSSVIALCQYFGWAQQFEPWMSAAKLGEAYANLRQRNQFASLSSIGLVALLWFVQGGLKPLHALPAIVLLAIGNAASASRTGALQLLLITIFAVVTAQRRARMVALCATALAVYCVAALVLPALLEAVTGVAGPSVFERFVGSEGCSSRGVLWSNVLDLISSKPWFGWGWGNLDYAHYMTLYPGARFCDILDNAHNLPLHLAVEAGIPVAMLVCSAIGWIVWRRAPSLKTSDPEREMAWAILGVILLHSLLEYPLWYGPFQIAFGLCLGFSLPAVSVDRKLALPQWQWPQWLLGANAVLLLLGIGYATWDYRRISQIYLPPEERAPAYQDDTLGKLRASYAFRNQVRFAELTLTPLTRTNAQWTFDTATQLLHYSPEPRVIEKVIESAVMLGRDDEAAAYLRRYRVAFPEAHALWAKVPPKP